MTNPPAPRHARRHPLEDEPARLEHIVDIMWAEIHKALGRRAPRRRRSPGSDVASRLGESVNDELLVGGSGGAPDILADALADLLQTPAGKVTTSWEALAVGIARNKAKGALRDDQAWLHATPTRPRLTLVSGDQPGPADANGDPSPPLFEVIADTDDVDLDEEFAKTSQQVELIRLAREILDDRDRTIFLGLHFGTRTPQSLATEFNLTRPGVAHVYRVTAKRLYDHPRFQRHAEGGTP
jgi:DNA-directed RNA polymerase specialized sigma24 family protein